MDIPLEAELLISITYIVIPMIINHALAQNQDENVEKKMCFLMRQYYTLWVTDIFQLKKKYLITFCIANIS